MKSNLPVQNKVISSLDALENYILKERYRGFDPFDGLGSPIFKLPVFKSNKIIRFTAQQVIKRFPLNVRPLLFIKKGLNPVTLGLSLQAFTYLSQINKDRTKYYREQIDNCIDMLVQTQSKGCSGSCWGYDFDWEARYAKINAYVPTIVATGIITNALFEYYEIYNDEKAKDLIVSASNFALKDLNRTYDDDGDFCFSYSPIDKQVVFNATMKAARLLAQSYSIMNDKKLLEEARRTITYVMKYQTAEGSWTYSEGDSRKWVDNFHTGYILDCLSEYAKITADNTFNDGMTGGIRYYVNNFLYQDSVPKYYNNKIYPVDSTACSQTIITLTRFGYFEKARNVVEWAIENLQDSKGYFYFQKNRFFTQKIPFMRWSNAWFFDALSYFLLNSENKL